MNIKTIYVSLLKEWTAPKPKEKIKDIITELSNDKGNDNNDGSKPHPSLIKTMKDAGYESIYDDDSGWSGNALPYKNEHIFERHNVYLNQHSWEHHHTTHDAAAPSGARFDVKKTKGWGADSLKSHLAKVHG